MASTSRPASRSLLLRAGTLLASVALCAGVAGPGLAHAAPVKPVVRPGPIAASPIRNVVQLPASALAQTVDDPPVTDLPPADTPMPTPDTQLVLDPGVVAPGVGQVLVVAPGDEAPQGVLARVTSTAPLGDGTTLVNGQAESVETVIPEGDYDFAVDLGTSSAAGVQSRTTSRVATPDGTAPTSARVNRVLVPEQTFTNTWCTGTAGPVTYNGSLSLDGDLKLKVKVRPFASSVTATLNLTEKAKAELKAVAKLTCQKTTNPIRLAQVTFVIYGITFTAFIDVTFDGKLVLDAAGSITFNQQANGWISLTKKEFRSPSLNHDFNGTSTLTKSIVGKAQLEGGVTPAVGISFYGLSAAIGVRGYAGVSADSTRTPSWEAYAGLQGRARLGSRAWYTFADKKWVLAHGVRLDTGALPDAVRLRPYAAQLAASGGRAPYTFSVLSAKPAWLNVSPTGALSGTPGTYDPSTTMRFRVMDADGDVADRDVSLVVKTGTRPPPPDDPPCPRGPYTCQPK